MLGWNRERMAHAGETNDRDLTIIGWKDEDNWILAVTDESHNPVICKRTPVEHSVVRSGI